MGGGGRAGRGMGSVSNGNALYKTMYDISQCYLQILEIARRKFFREKLPESMGREERKLTDQVYALPPGELRVLRKHPQFKELVRDMGLRLTPVPNRGVFRVMVSKFHKR